MVGVLLSILKIIGIILLVLLALILIIGAVILFVPIRYTADASYLDKKPGLLAKVTWLLNAVKFKAELKDKGLVLSLKVLWFTLFTTDDEEKSKKRRHKKEKHKDRKEEKTGAEGQEAVESESDDEATGQQGSTNLGTDGAVSGQHGSESGSPESDDEASGQQGSVRPESDDEASGQQEPVNTDSAKPESVKPESEEKESGGTGSEGKEKEDIGSTGVSVVSASEDSQYDKSDREDETPSAEDRDDKAFRQDKKYDADGGAIGGIIDKVREFFDFFHDPENDELISLIIRTAKSVFMHIRPRELEIEAIVGLEDPADTAKILAIAYMLYPLYNDSIRVEGDFVDECLEGRIHVAGRMHLIVFAVAGLRLYLNKDFRKLLHRIL